MVAEIFDNIEMTRFLFILLSVLCLAACKPGIPKDIIQPTEMENILYDIHVLDGYVGTIPTPDSARKTSAPLYKGIFKKYGIDSATHAKSMAYYYKRPDLLSKMYDKISDRISKERDTEVKKQETQAKLEREKLEKLAKAAAKRRLDSIKNVNKNKQTDTVKKIAKPAKSSLRTSQSTKN